MPRGSRLPDRIKTICSADSTENVDIAARAITTLMRERHRIGPDQDDDFNIRHPEEVVKAQLETSETLATLLTIVAGVSLLVGGIGIMNVMLASVTERRSRGSGSMHASIRRVR